MTSVEKVTKKRVIRISLAILVIVGILAGLLVASMLVREPDTSFDFLAEAVDGGHIEHTPRTYGSRRTTEDIYTFEADFNDVCTRARVELSASGFTPRKTGAPDPFARDYERFDNASGQFIWVSIFAGRTTVSHGKSEAQERAMFISRTRQEGLVSVLIVRDKPRLWPRYFLRHLHRRLRLARNRPPLTNK